MRDFLIQKLLDEQPHYKDIEIPQGITEQKQLLRSLFNIRMPALICDDFLTMLILQTCHRYQKAIYACINYGDAVCPDEIKLRSICIDEDIGKVLKDL